MGRPRKPTKLHLLSGSAAHDPQRMKNRANEPQISAPIGDPPAFIGEHGRAKWLELASHSEYGPVLTQNHRPAFEHFCVLYDRFVVDAMGGEAMKASDRQTYHSLCMQFGFTPASQSKVSMPQKPVNESPWDKVANL